MQSAPTPAPAPDPVKTAAAQSASNKDTAVAQYGLNATNQVTPSGSLNYSQIGTWADGTPRFQAETSLSPTEQGIFNTGEQTKQNLADIGQSQSAKIGALLDSPVTLPKLNLDTASTEARTMDLARQRLDPILAQRAEANKASLFNSGVLPGTEAYRRAMTQQGQNENDATNQLILQGHGQAVGDIMSQYGADSTRALTERNAPINEISALLSNSQVSQPNFISNTPTPGIAPTDVIGAQQQALNQQNVGFNAQNQQYQGMINGLFGLGKTAMGGINTPSFGGWSFGA